MYSKLWQTQLAPAPDKKVQTTELAQTRVLPAAVQQTTKLMPYGMLTKPTRHFFSDGDGLWGEHNPHFGSEKTGDGGGNPAQVLALPPWAMKRGAWGWWLVWGMVMTSRVEGSNLRVGGWKAQN
eukprot:CAMPEP_0184310804 /NCGR_PEP_ID=MMETSP1049-20130417/34642_1 /TAXON_ID=77928 /ORGANISM="Proteomonas sulcata, Strain CCMP704" /LENGTH=123 /DNA_ID=CAMNT_0026625473 /DNA_START=50 /DNA_END=422 /DNA_ORIENTATION=+